MRAILTFLFASFAVLAATTAQANRVALVIGNSDYEFAPILPNPANDARAMAAKLRTLGFETVEGYDLDFDEMRMTLRKFARQSRNADIATIFYAGHGIQVDGVNYLIPTDAQLDDPVDWEFQVYNIEEFLRHVRHSKGASLIFLDACRDNPLAQTLARSMGQTTRSAGGRGLAPIDVKDAASGMAIAFATSPGDVAQDGDGEHSPFTTALLKHIGAPNTDITEVMSKVTGDVFETTERQQRPWINASLTGPVVLNAVDTQGLTEQPLEGASRGTGDAAASIDVQKFMFEAATASDDPADFRAYLDTFPNGLFAQMARNAIRRIEVAEEEATPVEVASAAPVPVTPQPVQVPQTPQPEQVALATPQPQQALPLFNTGNAAQPNTAQAQMTRSLNTPLTLPVTNELRARMSNETTETMLNLSRDQKREIQGRLNASGHNVGGADGIFGRNTRAGMAAWQTQNGLIPTGYLNAVQHQLLTANTEIVYQAWLAARPTHNPVTSTRKSTAKKSTRRASTKKRTTRRTTKRTTKRTVRRNSNNDAAAAAALGFIAGAIIGRR